MSDDATSETPPPTPIEVENLHLQRKQTGGPDIVRDLVFWRNKYVSILALLAATATWVALQVYQFKFAEVVSWGAMFLATLMFFWGNIHRLLHKEAPDFSGILEISERSAVEMANGSREWIEEGIRWLFRVGAEREWFVFAGTVVALGLLSWIASCFDLLTLVYIGVVLGMTAPVIYVKYENKIKEYGWRSRMQSKKYYDLSKDKLKRMRSRVVAGKKQKKTE